MHIPKKNWKNIVYICILLAGICLLFQWYSATNRRRIENQNLNYAMDSADQTARRIKGEFHSAQLRMRNYAYLLGTSQDRPEIAPELLRGMEEHASFDAIRFTNAQGLNTASDGQTSDSRDRNYFLNGMQGKSGMEVLRSRITDQMMTVFYAPVEHDGEITGVLLGLYFAEDYLRDMLTTSYFGETADAYLCSQDGWIIASSVVGSHDQPLTELLLESGNIDKGTADAVQAAFQNGTESAGFQCTPESLSDNLCVIRIPDSDYVLVQAFPQSVTRSMLREANHAGMVLQVILICLFVVYIIVLLFHSRMRRKILEKQNTQFGYVLDGLNTLFSSRYLTVDLETNTYSYLAGIQPLNSSLAREGSYDDVIRANAQDLIEEEEKERFLQAFSPEAIAKALSEQDTFTYECHVSRNGKEDWEHLIAVRLQREAGRAGRGGPAACGGRGKRKRVAPGVSGTTVHGRVDRPLGSRHPSHPETVYPVNYGYIEGVLAEDGEEQDAYLLGADGPLEEFEGRVIAVYRRLDDDEDKWVVSLGDTSFSDEEIMERIRFQERFFRGVLLR